MDIWSALWILMAWCFSTRASVFTVLSMHPLISSCLWVKDPTDFKLIHVATFISWLPSNIIPSIIRLSLERLLTDRLNLTMWGWLSSTGKNSWNISSSCVGFQRFIHFISSLWPHIPNHRKKICCSYARYNEPIISKFCTCHDCWAVMACAKSWSDGRIIGIEIKAKHSDKNF